MKKLTKIRLEKLDEQNFKILSISKSIHGGGVANLGTSYITTVRTGNRTLSNYDYQNTFVTD